MVKRTPRKKRKKHDEPIDDAELDRLEAEAAARKEEAARALRAVIDARQRR
jgi:hypothetical protein